LSSAAGGAGLGTQRSAVLTIVDDEVTYGPGSTPFTDIDGDTYTVKLTGPGTARIHLVGSDEDRCGSIDWIALEGTSTASSLTISVSKPTNGSDGRVSIGKITGDGSLKSLVAAKCDITGSDVGIDLAGSVGQVTLGDVTDGASIAIGGSDKSSSKITLGDVRSSGISSGSTITSLTARSLQCDLLSAPAIGSLSTTAGALETSITVVGAVKSVSTKGGGASGDWSAGTFGTITISGGDFTGSLIATGTAASLGRKAAVSKFSVTGDFCGTLHALGTLSNVTIGGSMSNSTVAGASIGTFKIGGDLVDCVVLAGANLGADYQLDGTEANADTFGAGSIKTFSVGGDVENTMVGAGLDPVGLVFRNGNDEIVDGAKSKISSFTIKGTAEESNNYFRAGSWPKTVKIGGASVNPLVDTRFLDLQGFCDVGTTDDEGSVTLRVAGEEVAFQFLDDSSGHPIPGLVVGVSTGTGTEGIAVLEAFDPTSQYPPRFIVLHGPEEESSAAAQTARLAAASAVTEAAEPSVAIKIAESASDTLGKMGAVATVLDSEKLESLPVMNKSVKGLATASGLLEAIGYLAKAADTLTFGSVSKAVGALAPSRVQPVTDRAAELELIEQKAADATMQNLVLIGFCAATANAPGVAGAELSVAGTQLYKLVDEQTVLNAPEGHLAKVSLGFTDIYVSSETPVVDPTVPFGTMSITVTPDDVSPGGLGHLMLVSKDRLGDGQIVPLDADGHADISAPVGDYELVYQQENAEPVNQDVTLPDGGVEATIDAPPAPQVASLTLIAEPAITGLLDPDTEVQFSVVARDADGNLVEIDPNELHFYVYNPQGSSVADIDTSTGLLKVNWDQGAFRVVAEYGNTKSNLILGSGLGPAFNLPVIVIEDGSVVEGNKGTTLCRFDIYLDRPATQTVTVDYNAAWIGSATQGADYTDVTGKLTFLKGQTKPTRSLTVPVVGDYIAEGNEQFKVGLSNPVNARLNLNNSAIGTITDNDAAGITFSTTSGLVTTESGGKATFKVKLTSRPEKDVTIELAATAEGEAAPSTLRGASASASTAAATLNPASLTFTPSNWNTYQTVTVTGNDDDLINDGDRSYQIYVANVKTDDTFYAATSLAKPVISCTNRDNDKLGAGVVYVTVVGNGYVVDNKGQIDTRNGDYLATYLPDTFPILTAYDSSGGLAWCADWVPEGTSGQNCYLINSDYAKGLALTVYIDGQALTADSAAVSGEVAPAQDLDRQAVAGLFRQAVDAWASAGIAQAQLARLENVAWQFADLPGLLLGTASGTTILLDQNAAGFGWFVDPTPQFSEEFLQSSATSFLASGTSPAAGRVDLLTVMTHEVGHVLGFKDLDASSSPNDLMAGILGPGQRRVLPSAAVDAIFANGLY